ncbi:DUF58 domain-containing protein [Agromyces sp. H3Y2-19a]|uniref:DUF58 domain-containing protein n=1 Tax=Agromyces TaxID=33877 RepID=UPI001E3BCCBA|nr:MULTISPECIES: DUF58 domain-containing protein [Agromyces]MCD5346846.1 DUF58 domain-containing protein [Agromyces sp. S2-1-8]MDF0515035.1 DUF58 domain-containing protein [Agromyces chromiiresistens]
MQRLRPPRFAAWPRLTRRGGALLFVGVVLLAVSLWFDLRDIMLLAFVGIAMPGVAALFVALRAPKLGVTRTFTPPVVSAGSGASVAITVRNRARRTFDGAHWRDRVPEGLDAPPEAVLPAIGPYEGVLPSGDDTVHLEYRLRLPRRGVYGIGPLRVGVFDPFALARIDRDAGARHEVVVTPRVTPLERALGSAASVDGVLHGLQRRTHPNSDELIAREYRYGDPMRRVNWAATARRGELMVREEEQRGDPEVRILVDTTLAGRPRTGAFAHGNAEHGHAGFELGVEVVASIGVHLLERGFRVRCDPVADPARGSIATANSSGPYHMPGGDRLLLEDLARLEVANRDDAADRAPRGGGDRGEARAREARMPGFAVLVEPDERDAAGLVGLRQTIEPAIAFVAETVSHRVVEALEEADWRVVRVRRPASIGDAWAGIALRADVGAPGDGGERDASR